MRRPGAALAARDRPPGTAAVIAVVAASAALLMLLSSSALAAGATAHANVAAPADTDHYSVRSGDSLATISRKIAATSGMSEEVVEHALLKANPKAFIGGNASRLRTDVVLTVPAALRKDAPMAPQASEAVTAPPATRSADISSVAAAVSAMLGPVPDDMSGPGEQNSGAATSASASTPASMAASSEPLTQATVVQPGAVSSASARLETPAAVGGPASADAGGASAVAGASGASGLSGSAAVSTTPSVTSSAATAPAPKPAAAHLRWVIPLLVVLGLFLAWFSRRRWANPPPLPAGSARKAAGAGTSAGAATAPSGTLLRPVDLSGKEAGRREVEALDVLRETSFSDREEAALHVQLARAPRDVGALFGLLQLHARRGERAKVASFAHALWDETDAEGELWRRAATIGRSIDPENPLYSEDPFKALAEDAAKQPVRAALPIGALDLSLPDSMGAADSNAVQTVDDDSMALRADEANAEGEGGKPDLFRSSPALPASFDGLDLNLDDGAPQKPPASEAGRNRGRTGGRGKSGE